MKVLYFARMRDFAGVDEETAAPPPDITTIAALMDWLAQGRPALQQAFADENLRIARNQEYAQPDAPLKGAEEIAFFPPVTGG